MGINKGKRIPPTNETDEQVIAAINKLVHQRWDYGVRTELVEKPSYHVSWSNGSAAWYVAYGYGVLQPGEEVRLDANEILVPYRKDVLERVLPKVDNLPLYCRSTEGKMRGKDKEN
jgi:hypothetical protein